MIKKVMVAYDDSRKPDQEVCNITGKKSFGQTIYKRISLKTRVQEIVKKNEHVSDFYTVKELIANQDALFLCKNHAIFRLYSDFGITNEAELSILFEKACYVNTTYAVECRGRVAAVIYPDFEAFQKAVFEDCFEEYAKIETDLFLDLSKAEQFRQFITSGFDARFFNTLSGDDYTVIKKSNNIQKLKAEYTFYGLLPDDMKMWFVMPFSYEENGAEASYRMERYHMTDLAIRYVHGAISIEEFSDILQRLFHFIESRREKTVTEEEYELKAKELYIDKVRARIEQLKQCPEYERLSQLIASGITAGGIDEIVAEYEALYQKIMQKKRFKPVLVIGHGDLCFSNILYNRETSLVKLIDPKGATCEEELYTNPYYDLAKLSHSICGSYDYFNSDLFEISLNDKLKLKLKVDCDNHEFKEMFYRCLQEHGIDSKLVRLYEASLFLSMLPLHIDREKKVFGFICNAVDILKELEE